MNTKQQTLAILMFLTISLVMSGCGPGQLLGPTITPSPTNTPPPTPTSTPTPTFTLTLTPTLTPSPTFTQTPTIEPPSQLSNLFDGARLTYYESFDYFALEQWNTQACQTVNNGELEYACTDGYFGRRYLVLHEGEGALIDFKFVKQTDDYYWSINLSNGDYGKDNWKIFGISANREYGQGINLSKATTWLGFPTNWVKPDVWYRLALAMGENGRIMILVWERDNVNAHVWKYTNTMGKDWSGLEWLFWVNNTHTVVLDFDNYYQFAFSKIK
jgi:hypothetical protein